MHIGPSAITYLIDGLAILISVTSAFLDIRAGNRLARAIKDLHESHDELHELIRSISEQRPVL